MKKPIIFYVDDEPHNLVVFEAALPDEWTAVTYDSPIKALAAIESHNPAVIVSDQRMPGMMGVQFLELAKKIHPHAIRILVTGYSDEELVVESVRKAQVFDYIKKPWEVNELMSSLQRALDFFKSGEEARRLQDELKGREQELTQRNDHLIRVMQELENSKREESEMRTELECWVPPFVLRALREKKIQFPMTKDLVGITFDIVNSSRIHDTTVDGRSLRAQVLQLFSEAIIRHGGWRESQSGDSAYGHFGLLQENQNPAESALAVAREFRVALRSLAQKFSVDIECGIALHTAKKCLVDIHCVQLHTPHGLVTQKSFDTTSADIDLLHRMEKLVHQLPGSNIVMSSTFLNELKSLPPLIIDVGAFQFTGRSEPINLHMILSDLVKPDQLENFKQQATQILKRAI